MARIPFLVLRGSDTAATLKGDIGQATLPGMLYGGSGGIAPNVVGAPLRVSVPI